MKTKLIIIIILTIIALIDASYLTHNAYILKHSQEQVFNIWLQKKEVWFACDINQTFSCSSVFKNSFAWIFGLPFSLYAMIVYPIIWIIAFLGLKWIIKNIFKILLIFSFLWILYNWYLIVHEFIIWSYCFLCLICTTIIILIWIISISWIRKK
jgi:uncharacterized membrane protein